MPHVRPEIDWLDTCRRISARQADLFRASTSIAERSVYEGRGEGGDMTLELDRQCEDIAFEELAGLAADGARLLVISEERGTVTLGPEGGDGEDPMRVIIDPIDGSMNVRRTIPSHSLSFAVASGPSMADVDFGFVYDFGAREEFWAQRGEGARLDGRPLRAGAGSPPGDGKLEVIGLESADPRWVLETIAALRDRAYRVRAVGSIAITLSYVAAGRFDAALSARPCRSVDAAAAQLIVREAGGEVEFAGHALSDAGLGLEARYPVAAGASAGYLATARTAQDAADA